METLNRPVTATKTAQAVRSSKEQTDGTLATLRTENLLQTYRKTPQQAIVTLAQRYQQAPSAPRRQALGEMLSDTGDELLPDDRNRALGYYLDGARLCQNGALKKVHSKAKSSDRTTYNYCSGRVARILREGGPQGNATLIAQGPLKTYQLGVAKGRTSVHPASFDLLIPSSWVDIKDLKVPRVTQGGFGLAMVGHQKATAERIKNSPFAGGAGIAIALNATLRFSGNRATLVLTDAMIRSNETISGQTVPLAADYTVPFRFIYGQRRIGLIKIMGALRPAKFENTIGLFAIEPYREDKIPLILVHGLLSTAETWIPFANLLRADPMLREKYQIILYNYPTGNTLGKNSRKLRNELLAFQRTYDPKRRNPTMRNIVILGHSMGGILSNIQIRSTEGQLEHVFFKKGLNDIDIKESKRAAIAALLEFEANQDITRAVFIAAPHRGSQFAANPIGQFGAWLIRLPFDMIDTILGDINMVNAMTDVAQEASQRPRNSVSALRPDNPLLPALLNLPTRNNFPIHTIIAQRDPNNPTEEGSDGVVPYTSAHIKEATSELVVLNTNHREVPETDECVNEVLRILYKHVGLTRKAPPTPAP
jgi:pimeloyl-ACP methyl ester carboxylesterase